MILQNICRTKPEIEGFLDFFDIIKPFRICKYLISDGIEMI